MLRDEMSEKYINTTVLKNLEERYIEKEELDNLRREMQNQINNTRNRIADLSHDERELAGTLKNLKDAAEMFATCENI